MMGIIYPKLKTRIEQSLFSIKKLELTFNTKIDSDLYDQLCSMYPKNKKFANNGILLSLEKESNKRNLQKTQIQIKSQSLVECEDNWQLSTPIAFIIFNRPETTQKVFNAIREAKPPKLLVIADGARLDKEGEAELCQQTRAIINQVDWDCEVLINYSDINLGCRKRVSSGLDWVFEQVEEAIILEDDCLPHPTFFRYCQVINIPETKSPIILIDGVFFQLYKTGIARVWKSLLEQWANTDFANHILVLDRTNTAPKINGIRFQTCK